MRYIHGVVLISNNLLIPVVAFITNLFSLLFTSEFGCQKVSGSNMQFEAVVAKVV
jgi:hypothetical protein